MQSIEGSLGIGRAYRVRWSDRIFSLVAFVFLIAVAIGFFRSATQPGNSPALALLGIGVLVIVAGFGVLSTFYNRVVLYPNAIEYRTVWSTSWLQFGEIRGRHFIPGFGGRGGKGPRLRIVPSEANLPRLEFEKIYNFDDAFYGWFNKLPDLDRIPR